jgi:hypothetical protein
MLFFTLRCPTPLSLPIFSIYLLAEVITQFLSRLWFLSLPSELSTDRHHYVLTINSPALQCPYCVMTKSRLRTLLNILVFLKVLVLVFTTVDSSLSVQ